ncbi:MAG: MFS transporter [Rhodoferax sp.]|uniref:MFS transporter n=1 Tax=Rhodoferax sp. TaxID=50421 RepID=UPI002ACDD943|nr:MFS transporter [Rhodoferax sp.]MDZ7890776.1 MFS transporter [Rhodoferax sp.]
MSTTLTTRQGLRYGMMGLPLAFVALPLYVVLPNHYAKTFGVSMAALGGVLLFARLLDAFFDPLLGRWSDALYQRGTRALLQRAAAACVLLGTGFYALFFPWVSDPQALLYWAAGTLLVTYLAYSFLSISHQSWGAMLGGDESYRSKVVAWREGLGLAGVITAAITPVALGLPATTAIFFIAISVGLWLWTQAPTPAAPSEADHADGRTSPHSVWRPLGRPDFRALLAVFVVNGIASAIPATLILFFVQDRLQAPPAMEPLFLGSYFLCGALAIPLWLKVVGRIGLAKTWLCGMLLSIAVFIFASQLGAGDTVQFVLVCALSGVALGTDLTIPGALLAGLIARQGDQGQAEGAYFGWWNFVTKLNLALAAGVALPALAWWGYAPGARDPVALNALTVAYCLLPCGLKALAAGLLYTLILRRSP